MPLLPGITDGANDLEQLAREASEAGAEWFGATVLFLMPASREQFLPFLQKQFPHLSRRYQEYYGNGNAYPPEEYSWQVAQRVDVLRKKYHLVRRLPERGSKHVPPTRQLSMW